MIQFLDRQLGRLADYAITQEKCLVVEGAQAERRLVTRGMFRLLASIGLLLAAQLTPSPISTVAWGAVGGLLGSTALVTSRRASAYRSGWLAGRRDMVDQAVRTESGQEWINAVMIYDLVHVMGFGVETPDSPEGLSDD